MKKEREKYCLLWGFNPRPNGTQETGVKIHNLVLKSSLKIGSNANVKISYKKSLATNIM